MDETEELLERWQQMREAVLEWGRKLTEALHPFIIALSEWVEAVQREELYRRLRRWRVPHSLARFLARRWPRRWLRGLGRIG